MARNLPVNTARIAADIDALAALTEPDRPWTRRAFTPKYQEGRAWLAARMREAGLATAIDAAGNLIGRRAGRRPGSGTLMIGSHSDTVPEGGRFDGIAGVIAGLEVARALDEAGVALEHDLEIVDFLAEEVSIFGVSCIGSRGMTGQMPGDWLAREKDGRDLRTALAEAGGNASALGRRDDIAGFLELHIEQGPVLEAGHEAIGIVTAIAGITRISVTVTGRADHAGTTPMDSREDALVKAAALVGRIHDRALEQAAGPSHFTATVGEFAIRPGAANVVPSGAEMLIDARAERREDMESFLEWIERQVTAVGGTARVVSDNPPCPSDPRLCDLLDAAADRLGARHRRMVSGAGHDTAWLGKIAPAAMIFVPCREGRSHSADEWAETSDIAMGAAVLFETLRALDGEETSGKD